MATSLRYVALSDSHHSTETKLDHQNMAFMVLATWLYLNACAKGEECIPQTWDMFHEKWGFLVIFWNFAGVPFVRLSIIFLLPPCG